MAGGVRRSRQRWRRRCPQRGPSTPPPSRCCDGGAHRDVSADWWCSSPGSRARASPRSPVGWWTGCTRRIARSPCWTATWLGECCRPVSASAGRTAARTSAGSGGSAAEVARHGGVAVLAPIAPFAAHAGRGSQDVEANGDLVLVWISTPLEECERRDRKGLYGRRGAVRSPTSPASPPPTSRRRTPIWRSTPPTSASRWLSGRCGTTWSTAAGSASVQRVAPPGAR